jgi:hypothetical protein
VSRSLNGGLTACFDAGEMKKEKMGQSLSDYSNKQGK